VVTQNIDGLHLRAGSGDVLELHGSIRRFKCLHGRHGGFSRADVDGQTARPPRCPACGEMIRPDVVWFGEQLAEAVIERAFRLAEDCDAMLVVGTSGVVQPAASLPLLARRSRAFVVDVNPERDEIADLADVFLQGPGGEVLPRLLAAMEEEAAQNGVPL
jgi:NAD-dependent deacetylase